MLAVTHPKPRPATLADSIRAEARRHRAIGTPTNTLIADILDHEADDIEWTGAETFQDHQARLEAWKSWSPEIAPC